MTALFRTIQEVKAYNDFGQQYSDQIYNATLSQNTNTSLTVPGGGAMGSIGSFGESHNKNKVMAVIRTSADVWLAVGATAAVPAGATFLSATSELVTNTCEMAKLVNVGDVLNFFSSGTSTSVSVTFYAMPA